MKNRIEENFMRDFMDMVLPLPVPRSVESTGAGNNEGHSASDTRVASRPIPFPAKHAKRTRRF